MLEKFDSYDGIEGGRGNMCVWIRLYSFIQRGMKEC